MNTKLLKKSYPVALAVLAMLCIMLVAIACGSNQYTVTFEGEGGTLVSGEATQTVEKGKDATPPVYEKEGFTFNGWDRFYESITRNTTITAIWESNFSFTKAGEGYEVTGIKVVNDIWTDISVPSTYLDKPVIGIGSTAFVGRTNLTSITIPDSVQYINKGAFGGTNILRSITLPFVGGQLYQPSQADEEDEALTEPEERTDAHFGYIFGANDYLGNKDSVPESLTSVTITGGTEIWFAAFHHCLKIEEIKLPDTIENIGLGAFVSCQSLKAIDIPSVVTFIGPQAFQDCRAVKSIIVPEGVTIIREFAFANCDQLKTITIPSTVEAIGVNALAVCPLLEKVIINATTPPPLIGEGYLFGEGVSPTLKIFVPAESLEAYNTTNGWAIYSKMISAQ